MDQVEAARVWWFRGEMARCFIWREDVKKKHVKIVCRMYCVI